MGKFGEFGDMSHMSPLGLAHDHTTSAPPLGVSPREAATLTLIHIGMGVPGWGEHCTPGGGDAGFCRWT